MKKTIITIVIILASLGLIGFILTKNKAENEAKTAIVAEKNASVSVKVDTVKTEEVSLDFVSNGNFEPIQELKFAAEKSGKVTQVLVKEGDYVKAGQTLAIVRSDVINVNAQNANAVYQNAVADYTRFENAFKTGGVTKQQLDQARLAMVNAKANESQVASLKVGSVIKVGSNVYPDKEFTGKITFIAPKADASLNFPVEIEITNNTSNDLKAGMYGTAKFASNQQKQMLKIVPRNAFVGSVSSNEIFVIENGTAKLKKVTAGRILGDKVEILDGLSNGEIVIVTGQINLQDGNAVEVIK